MVKLKKRLPVLLMTAVIIPVLIISILGIYLVSQQKNARLLNVKNEFTNRLLRIRTNSETRIRQLIKSTFQQIETGEYNQKESVENAVEIYLQLYEEILNYEINVKFDASAVEFAFFKNEALDYLNRHARKESQKKGENRVNPAKAIEQLEKTSELDISLKWFYFEWEEETGGTDKEKETSRFSRLQ